jgi:hypothetical protein
MSQPPCRRSLVGPGIAIFAACCLLAAAGCGSSAGSRLTGTVKFKGEPVASGKIYFSPATKDAEGHVGFADIRGGSYDTSQRGSQGVVGGPTTVKIEGFDAGGTMQFSWATKADLPKEGGTKDFEVPADAAKNAAKPPEKQP